MAVTMIQQEGQEIGERTPQDWSQSRLVAFGLDPSPQRSHLWINQSAGLRERDLFARSSCPWSTTCTYYLLFLCSMVVYSTTCQINIIVAIFGFSSV
jgi:hypothetical protein